MPKVKWGIDANDIDDFDRESQYAPYQGPEPKLNTVYHWRVKIARYIAGTREKKPQLRLGLELYPRAGRNEDQYAGYFIMAFIPVTPRTQFRYVPFLDAIGVTGDDFASKTRTDMEGNITRIGPWRHDGNTLIAAQLESDEDENGNPRTKVGWIGEPIDSEEIDDDDALDSDDDEEELDEAPKQRKKVKKSTRTKSKTRSRHDDDDVEF